MEWMASRHTNSIPLTSLQKLLIPRRRDGRGCGIGGVAVGAGSRLRAADVERLPDRHIGSRDHAAFGHQHSSIVAHRFHSVRPKAFSEMRAFMRSSRGKTSTFTVSSEMP